MRAGKLRSRITILRPSAIQDRDPQTGEFKPPIPFAIVWADIVAQGNKYNEQPQQIVTETVYRIEIRYLAGVTTAMIVESGTQLYEIKGVDDPDKRKRRLYLTCYLRNDGRTSN